MIRIKSRNQNSEIIDLLRDSAVYLCGLLDLDDSLDITIILKKTKKILNGVMISKGNNKFELTLNSNLGIKTQISFLAHELVHVKQIVKNELVICEGNVQWKGRSFVPLEIMYGSKMEFTKYQNQPWEREAYDTQDELASLVFEYFKDRKIKLAEDLYVNVF